jgi:hypothetical protein
MLFSYFAISIATTYFLVLGAVLPASDVVVVSRGVNLTILSPPPVFTRLVGTTDVTTVRLEPDVTFSTGVTTATIAQNTALAVALYTASARALCFASLAYTILFSF